MHFINRGHLKRHRKGDTNVILKCLVLLNGIIYIHSSLSDFMEGKVFKWMDSSLAPEWYFSGIFVGIMLLVSAIGMLAKKRLFYSLALIVYKLLIVYGVISVVMAFIKLPIAQAWAPVMMLLIHILIFYLFHREITKARNNLLVAQNGLFNSIE